MTAGQHPLPHTIRRAVMSDMGIIIDPWLQEVRYASSSRFVHDRQYVPDQKRLIKEILQTAEVLVACAPDSPNHVYGWIAFGPGDVIHWCYVKDAYRQLGIADHLLSEAFPNRPDGHTIYATHVSAGTRWRGRCPTCERGARERQRAGEKLPRPSERAPDCAECRSHYNLSAAAEKRRIVYRPHLLMRAS